MLVFCLALVGPAAAAQDAAADANSAAAGKPARAYLEFSTQFTSDCMLHRAQLRRIQNTHPERTIRVTLVSYTGKTRSQGQSVKRLVPGAEPAALGCDGTSGLARRWEIVDAEFVDAGTE